MSIETIPAAAAALIPRALSKTYRSYLVKDQKVQMPLATVRQFPGIAAKALGPLPYVNDEGETVTQATTLWRLTFGRKAGAGVFAVKVGTLGGIEYTELLFDRRNPPAAK